MPFGFLVPAMLAGLAALALPLLLHLRQRERQRPRAFPSLMFLARIPIRTDRRKRVTDLPLLLLRLLALALLVMAFARPFVRRVLPAEAATPGLTVLAIDRSQSMGYRGVSEVVAESVAVLLDAIPAGERVAVVGYGADASVLAMPTADRATVREAVREAVPLASGTRHRTALRAAGQLLVGEPLPGRIIMVTDAQRDEGEAGEPVTLPARTTLRVVRVGALPADNAAVVGVEVAWLPAAVGRRAAVAAQLRRSGGTTARSAVATLWVDGREAATVAVELPAEGTVTASFPAVMVPLAAARLEVRLPEDGLLADDRFHAVVPADATMRVLLVGAAGEAERFVTQALEIGTPRIVVERRGTLDVSALERSALVWFQDVPPPDGAAGEVLADWVARGGGIVVAAGDRWGSERRDAPILPAAIRGRTTRGGATLGEAARTHPVLAPFAGQLDEPLATVRIRAHPVLEPRTDSRVLLRYDDGTPAAVVGAVGEGRTMMLGIPLDLTDGDFPVQPSFLPFVRGVALWAGGQATRPLARLGGEVWAVAEAGPTGVLRAPDGTDAPVRDGLAVLTPQAGVHAVFAGAARDVAVAQSAVNAPPAEADLAAGLPDELLQAMARPTDGGGTVMASSAPAVELEHRQAGWRWVLVAVALLLAAETWVASRGWRGIAAPTPTTEGGTA